jgi:hypothetical protein
MVRLTGTTRRRQYHRQSDHHAHRHSPRHPSATSRSRHTSLTTRCRAWCPVPRVRSLPVQRVARRGFGTVSGSATVRRMDGDREVLRSWLWNTMSAGLLLLMAAACAAVALSAVPTIVRVLPGAAVLAVLTGAGRVLAVGVRATRRRGRRHRILVTALGARWIESAAAKRRGPQRADPHSRPTLTAPYAVRTARRPAAGLVARENSAEEVEVGGAGRGDAGRGVSR